jgi:two-component system sensor histidine kinase EvgS
MSRPIALPPAASRRVIEVVERLRWVLPVAIFLVVLVHQAWEAATLAAWSPTQRFLQGVLLYGLIGPLVTFWTLDWIARAMRQREAIEARARRDERYLASITSSSADAIFSLDTHDTIQSWNRGAQETFGFRSEEVIGRSASLLVPAALAARGELAVIRDRLYEDGVVRGYQTERLRADGSAVPVELTQTLLRDDHGQIVGSSVILRDIRARLEAEAAVRRLNRELEARVAQRTRQLEALTATLQAQNEALEAANAELKQVDALKDEFVDLVSHELRAPLTTINASVELLLARRPADGVVEKLAIIGQEVSRLTRLVQSVLDISRINAGRLELHATRLDPSELCARALARVEDGGQLWRVDVAPGTPAVWADEDRAGEVLGNLLANAANYTPAGSGVTLSVRPAPDGTRRAVWFAVHDEGGGIPPEEQERIFQRFHRLERGDARTTYGHGLGLYIARRLVEAQGGRIWVDSVPGEGATFTFTLPAAAGPEGR